MLKKELQEKQDLIVNAAKAIDQMDLIQKEAENRFEGVIEELNQKITFLEMENKELERSQKTVASAGTQLLENFKFPESGDEFSSTNRLHELEVNLKEVTSQIQELEAQLKDKTNHIEELNNKVQSLQFEKQELREQLEGKSQDVASFEVGSMIKFRLFSQLFCWQQKLKGLPENLDEVRIACRNFQVLEKEYERQKAVVSKFNIKFFKQDQMIDQLEVRFHSSLILSSQTIYKKTTSNTHRNP